jgi:hypothetical protein
LQPGLLRRQPWLPIEKLVLLQEKLMLPDPSTPLLREKVVAAGKEAAAPVPAVAASGATLAAGEERV